jgi:hypothetical protein
MSFKYKPATDVGVVAGGHSAPGINEGIGAMVNMTGDLIAAALFIPPIGGALDSVLKPIYTDVVGAFQKWKDIGRAGDLGWSHFHETIAEGADRAYTLSALIALRSGMWRTREQTSHTLTVADGFGNLRVGQNGKGNAYLGTRIGSTCKDWGKPGRVYVDRVSEVTLSYDRKTSPTWQLTIGARADEDPFVKGLEMLQEMAAITRELGML